MRKKIKVLYGPNGEIQIEALGYKGKSCKEATAFLEKILGEVSDVKEKAEWWIANGREVRKSQEKFGIKLDNLCG